MKGKGHSLTSKQEGDALISAFMVWGLHRLNPDEYRARSLAVCSRLNYHCRVGKVADSVDTAMEMEILLLLPNRVINM